MLEPMAEIWSCTCLLAPWPTPTMAMTAPTPMMMPSMVSAERILLRDSARIAIRRMDTRSITSSQSSTVGMVFSMSAARGRSFTSSSRRIFPSRNTMLRLAKRAMSGSCVTSTIVNPLSFSV
jgi:hypothetical protein